MPNAPDRRLAALVGLMLLGAFVGSASGQERAVSGRWSSLPGPGAAPSQALSERVMRGVFAPPARFLAADARDAAHGRFWLGRGPDPATNGGATPAGYERVSLTSAGEFDPRTTEVGIAAITSDEMPILPAEDGSAVSTAAQLRPLPLGRRGLGPGRPASLLPMYVTFAVLQALDAHTTSRASGTGAREANPVVAPFATNPAALFAIKASAVAATVLLTERIWKKNRLAAIAVMIVANAGYSLVVKHNLSVLARR